MKLSTRPHNSNEFVKWMCILNILYTTVSGYPQHDTFASSNPVKKSYAGYKLVRTGPVSVQHANTLRKLDTVHGVNFWTYPVGNRTVDILIAPGKLNHVQAVLENMGLDHDVLFENAEAIEKNGHPRALFDLKDGMENSTRAISPHFFSNYQRYDAIMNFVSQLARENPGKATYYSIGKSYEGRNIGLLKISTGGGGSKPAIFIDGGMHAREWISPATVMYIMYKLVNDPSSKQLTDRFDWYIVPVVNVDGYEYTHTNDRYWRKTRSRNSNGCYGVDPNRNFGFHWAESGSSNKPCSDIYHGPKAFSEVETQALARTLTYMKDQVKLYLTFHAYSQMWLVPWGYIKGQKPKDYNELIRMAQHGKAAMERTYGTKYTLGTAPDLLYPAAGGSDDWAKGALGIPYAYCLELRDKGRYGFALPPSQIKASGEETFNGVVGLANELFRTLKRSNKLHSDMTVNAEAPAA